MNLLLDYNQVECRTPQDVLDVVNSTHSGRVLCCVSTSKFCITSCPFPIFFIEDQEDQLLFSIATLFQSTVTHIYFYHKTDLYYAFSNFFSLPGNLCYTIQGECYHTVEHYFQSKKFSNSNHVLQILQSNSAKEAFQTARTLNAHKLPQWEQVKYGIMKEALQGKFKEQELLCLLYFTGKALLYEHTEKDTYWADGGFGGEGQNHLGKLLMELRNEISLEMTPPKLEQFYNQSLFYACWQNETNKVMGPPNVVLDMKKQQQQAKIKAMYTALNATSKSTPR